MAEKRKSKRRSSILKSLDNTNYFNDGRQFERRRVSFSREIMVKEFHKPASLRNQEKIKSAQQEKEGQSPKDATPTGNLTRIYTVGANESYYQMSTPIGMKKRRISESTIPGRFSVIPALEKSFLDESDFEVFEEDSSCDVIPNSKITMPEPEDKKLENQFGCSPHDNFGEECETLPYMPVEHVTDEVGKMSLTLEEDELSLQHTDSIDYNDTMSSTVHVQEGNRSLSALTQPVNLSIFGKVGLTETNEMDPLAFPVSLLTPPKPPVDDIPGPICSNASLNVVKELITESIIEDDLIQPHMTMSENDTVYGGGMSMTMTTCTTGKSFDNILDCNSISIHGDQSGNISVHGNQSRNISVHGNQSGNIGFHGNQSRNISVHGDQSESMISVHGNQTGLGICKDIPKVDDCSLDGTMSSFLEEQNQVMKHATESCDNANNDDMELTLLDNESQLSAFTSTDGERDIELMKSVNGETSAIVNTTDTRYDGHTSNVEPVNVTNIINTDTRNVEPIKPTNSTTAVVASARYGGHNPEPANVTNIINTDTRNVEPIKPTNSTTAVVASARYGGHNPEPVNVTNIINTDTRNVEPIKPMNTSATAVVASARYGGHNPEPVTATDDVTTSVMIDATSTRQSGYKMEPVKPNNNDDVKTVSVVDPTVVKYGEQDVNLAKPPNDTNVAVVNTTMEDQSTTVVTYPLPPINNSPALNQLHLPTGRTVMGKRRPIISSNAVVSKHLAVGTNSSNKTPKKVSLISHMKSPYLTRSVSAKKDYSTRKKRKNDNVSFVSPYNLRSPSQRMKKIETIVEIPTEVKTHPEKDTNLQPKRTLPLPVGAQPHPVEALPHPVKALPQPVETLPQPVETLPQPVETLPQPVETLPQPVERQPHPLETLPQLAEFKPRQQPIEAVPHPLQIVEESGIDPTDEDEKPKIYQQPQTDNHITETGHVMEGKNADETFVICDQHQSSLEEDHVETVQKSINHTTVVIATVEDTYVKPLNDINSSSVVLSSDDVDYDWMNEDLSFSIQNNKLLAPSTPISRQQHGNRQMAETSIPYSAHQPKPTTPINPHQTMLITSINAHQTMPITSVDDRQANQTTPKPAAIFPSKISSSKLVQIGNDTTTRNFRRDFPLLRIPQKYKPSPDYSDVSIRSPGIIILDNTVDESVSSSGYKDIHVPYPIVDDSKTRRLSIGRRKMDKLLTAMPDANVTLHLEAEYNQQMEEKAKANDSLMTDSQSSVHESSDDNESVDPATLSITMGDRATHSITMGGRATHSITMGDRATHSITMSDPATHSITIGDPATHSITMGNSTSVIHPSDSVANITIDQQCTTPCPIKTNVPVYSTSSSRSIAFTPSNQTDRDTSTSNGVLPQVYPQSNVHPETDVHSLSNVHPHTDVHPQTDVHSLSDVHPQTDLRSQTDVPSQLDVHSRPQTVHPQTDVHSQSNVHPSVLSTDSQCGIVSSSKANISVNGDANMSVSGDGCQYPSTNDQSHVYPCTTNLSRIDPPQSSTAIVHNQSCTNSHFNAVISSQQSSSSVMYPVDGANCSIPLDPIDSSSDASSTDKSHSHISIPCSHVTLPHSNEHPDEKLILENTPVLKEPIPTPRYFVVAGSDVTPLCVTSANTNNTTNTSITNKSHCLHTTSGMLSVNQDNDKHNTSLQDGCEVILVEQDKCMTVSSPPGHSPIPSHVPVQGHDLVSVSDHISIPDHSSISIPSHAPEPDHSSISIPSHAPVTESHTISDNIVKCSNSSLTDANSQRLPVPSSSVEASSDCSYNKLRTAQSSFATNASTFVSEEAEDHCFLEYLEALHSRFKIVNDATTVRLSPKYSTDKQVIEIVKFFHLKTTCCVYTLRCMIDFIRLSDMSDSVCDMDPINWAELPIPVFDNHDIKGVLMDKALWVQSLTNYIVPPLYKLIQEIMKSIKRCFGWTIRDWNSHSVEIDVRSMLRIDIGLLNEGESTCTSGQKIEKVSYEFLNKDQDQKLDLLLTNYKTVIEIPVMMLNILQFV